MAVSLLKTEAPPRVFSHLTRTSSPIRFALSTANTPCRHSPYKIRYTVYIRRTRTRRESFPLCVRASFIISFIFLRHDAYTRTSTVRIVPARFVLPILTHLRNFNRSEGMKEKKKKKHPDETNRTETDIVYGPRVRCCSASRRRTINNPLAASAGVKWYGTTYGGSALHASVHPQPRTRITSYGRCAA